MSLDCFEILTEELRCCFFVVVFVVMQSELLCYSVLCKVCLFIKYLCRLALLEKVDEFYYLGDLLIDGTEVCTY